jgi:hypothetical protein
MKKNIMEGANGKKRVQVATSVTERIGLTSRQKSLVPRGRESKPTNASQARSGPRTVHGKQKSKYNALKHGIFAGVVLPNESRSQYESLLTDLIDNLSPKGRLEEILVEKLAMLSWRQKRLVEAERAEIQNSADFLEWEEENRQLQNLRGLDPPSPVDEIPLIDQMENPKVLERCLELLGDLKKGLEARGFDEKMDSEMLRKIYGVCRQYKTLGDIYSAWYGTSQVSEEVRQREGYASPAVCKERVLEEIEEEIARLMEYQEKQKSAMSKRFALARVRLRVPQSPDLDRLLKYETSLDRSFARNLDQLERWQRMRLGQPVPPPLHVNVVSNDMPVP